MSDYETTQAKHNITVGIFVVLAMCAFVWLIYKFRDLPTSISKIGSFQVLVQFPVAQGVEKDTPVRFCGYQLGRVTKVMPPQKLIDLKTRQIYHQTTVALSIDRKYSDIPSNVGVKVMTRGLGSSHIELSVDPDLPLVPTDPNRPETMYLLDRMLMQGSAGVTSEFFPVESQEKLDELADGLKTLVDNANDILSDKTNKENLKVTLANLSEASKNAKQTLEEIEKFFAAGTDASEQLSKTVAELRLILEKINSGQGTFAKLINDGRFYENLLENTHQMQVLLEELRSFVAKSQREGLPIKLK